MITEPTDDRKAAMIRQAAHEALDKMLDAADANGNDISMMDVRLFFIDVEDNAAGQSIEQFSVFNTELQNGVTEEAYLELIKFKDGVMQGEAVRHELE